MHSATIALVPAFLHIPSVHTGGLQKVERHTIPVRNGRLSSVVPFNNSCTHCVAKIISLPCFSYVHLQDDEVVTHISSISLLCKLSRGSTELRSQLQEMNCGILHSDKSRKCLELRLI